MAIHDAWTFDHAPQSTADVSTGSGTPAYSETSLYNTYSGNPGYAFNNGISNAIQITTDGYLTMNSSASANPGLAIQASEIQDWSVATTYWIGFRTKTSKQNTATSNIFTMCDTITQTTPSALLTEADMASANANTVNQDYYVEIFIDRVNKVYQVWINGSQVKSGTIAAGSVVANGNGFYWFGAYNSGGVPNSAASRAYRDFYFLDVDATDTQRLGSIRSSLAPLTAVTAPNYTTTGNALTVTGSAAISTAQSKFGGSSLSLGATTSSSVQIANSASLQMSGDCTYEAWVMVTSNSAAGLLFAKETGSGPTYNEFQWSNGNWRVFIESGGTTPLISVSSGIALNTWMHIALVHYNGTWYLYQNGVLLTSASSTAGFGNNSSNFIIGNWGGFANQWLGYIDEVRISNIARYTSAFTPSTQAFSVDANTVSLIHFDGSNGGPITDAMATPLGALQASYSNPPSGGSTTTNAPSDDPLTSTFTSSVSAGSQILAVGYKVAASSTSLANLNVSLSDGTNTVVEPAYAFPDTSTMKYGRRALFSRTAADGGAWSAAKVNANKLILTPTN